MVAWWKILEEKRARMSKLELRLLALDRAERNMLNAIDKFERRIIYKIRQES